MMLDVEEYFHLAVHASKEGDHHAALEHLYRILEIDPEHTATRYLLAAEHAELGLYDRACNELEEVLRMAPEMEAARFQFGLLTLQLGRLDEARNAFVELSEKAMDESLRAFASAYLHLLEERIEDAMAQLSAGIGICSNLALKADMTLLLSTLKEGANRPTDEGSGPEAGSPVFLGAYGNSLEVP